MRKKLYLVALFCGALCLTGCLKNEESASVTQVRFAKANELNSLAALNNAKAQATTIAAEADAALKAAQAKVAEAEAKLKEADAAYRDAETQLKLVEVALQEVKVKIELVKLEEEQVELEKKYVELAKLQEELNVAKAQAAADIAYWVAYLEDIQRDAEIAAAKDALALLKAMQDIEDYAANLEKTQAAAIKEAAGNYFTALNTVTILNAELIAANVDYAKSGYDKNANVVAQQDNIAKKQQDLDAKKARLEELEALATMTQEELDAANKAAEAAFIAALEKYEAAKKAQGVAEKEMSDEMALKSKFYNDTEHNWKDFTDKLYVAATDYSPASFKSEEGKEEGYTTTYPIWGFVEQPEDPEAKPVFVPLFNYEYTLEGVEYQYPDPSIYGAVTPVALIHKKIVPATINYDNIKHLEELSLNKVKDEVKKAIDDPETGLKAKSAKDVEEWNNEIAEKTHDLGIHKDYVEKRKGAVQAAEKALDDALKAYNESKIGHEDAVQAYQEYMVVEYNISRTYFEAVWNAAKDTVATSEAYWNAKADFEAKVAAEATLNTKQTEAYDAMKTAETTYGTAKTAWETEVQPKIDAQKLIWNPEFAYTVTDKKFYGNGKDGSSQYYWMVANNAMVDAENTMKTAKEAWDLNPTNETLQNNYWIAYGKWSAAVDNYNDKDTAMKAEEKKYNDILAESTAAKQALDDAIKAWNPEFDAADPSTQTKNAKGEWVRGDKVAGTSQAAMLDAYVAWNACNTQVTKDLDKDSKPTALKNWNEAKAAHEPKLQAFSDAWDDLVTELGFDPATYEGDATAEDLWKKAEVAAKDWSTVTDEFNKLWALYIEAPDAPYTGKVGWLISNYEIDPYAEYVWKLDNSGETAKVEKQPIAFDFDYSKIVDGKKVVDPSKSLDTKIKDLEKKVADEPKALEKKIADEEKKITDREELIADLEAKIAAYKQYEAEYTAWVASREAKIKAANEAKVAAFDEEGRYKIAVEVYEAARGDFYKKVVKVGTDYKLVEISVQEAIKTAEEAVKAAEKALATEKHNLDVLFIDNAAWLEQKLETIAVLNEKIEIYNAIADYYKAILDGLMDAAGILPDEEEVPAE